MRESIGIDSVLGGWAMPKAYSEDMRARVIAEVESGASRRAAAEEFDVSTSTAIIWVKCFRETGRCTAKPRGGSVSPLEKHADFLLGLIARRPDPIEMPFSKLKASLRKAAERTIPRLRRRIGTFAGTVTARESCNYFRHAGYE